MGAMQGGIDDGKNYLTTPYSNDPETFVSGPTDLCTLWDDVRTVLVENEE